MYKRAIHWVLAGCVLAATTSVPAAEMAHRWSFNGDTTDSVGGRDAVIVDLGDNNADLSDKDVTLTGGAKGNSDYIDLPDGIISGLGDSATIEIWATPISVQNWSRIFDFGSGTAHNVFMSWTMGTDSSADRVEWLGDAAATADSTNAPYELGTEYHIVCVFEPGTVTWYTAPAGAPDLGPAKGSFEIANLLSGLDDINCWLGRSQWPDDTANASYNECRLWVGALTPQELEKMHDLGPDRIDLALAAGPSPAHTATDVIPGSLLRWESGDFATEHDVYLGTSWDDVNDATRENPLGVLVSSGQTENSYDPGLLELGQTYFWRIDEVNDLNPDSPWKGDIWSFRVEAVAYAIPPSHVTVIPSSFPINLDPNNLINGVGLNEAGQHSTNPDHMWLSGDDDPNVNVVFAFDKVYKLHQLHVWNSNQSLEPHFGLGVKDAVIEISDDGTTWAVLQAVEIPQATGKPDYDGSLLDLGGVSTQYVRFRLLNGWKDFLPQVGLSEVVFLHIPTRAREFTPVSETTALNPIVPLSWRSGREVVQHEVYFGTDPNNLSLIETVSEPTLTVTAELGQIHYWQIVEVNDAENPSAWAGEVLSFSTNEFIALDDMESYRNKDGFWIWQSWLDGLEDPANNNGSVVGHGDLPETVIVMQGRQSLPLAYNGPSWMTHNLDWTAWDVGGVQLLRIIFSGAPDNTGSGLYVEVNGQKVSYPMDAHLASSQWRQWDIPLSDLGNPLTVESLSIGVTSGSGMLYFDNIGLYLDTDAAVPPVDPGTAGLVAQYPMEGDLTDSSGNNHHGTVEGGALFGTGLAGMGQVMLFDGLIDYADLPIGSVVAASDSMTVSLWVNTTDMDGDIWQRLFDFGSDTTNYMFLTTRTFDTGAMRFAIKTPTIDEGLEQPVNASSPLSPGWHHVAVVIDSTDMSLALYLDGILLATAPTLVLPSDMGETTQNYLGKSQWDGDAMYEGALDDVSIFNRALSAGEISHLADIR